MKKYIIIVTMLFAACSAPKSTDRLLAEVWQSDQQVRRQIIELTKAVTTEGRTDLIDSLIMVCELQESVDAHNISIIDSLLQDGVPNCLSKESYKTIWIVIDHSTLEKQLLYLPIVEQMATDGLIDKDEYATLFDRVAMGQKRPQRYGSQSVQFGRPEAMQLYIYPVENSEKLDSLRATVGMEPIAEYLKVLTQTTGIEAQFDRQMTIDCLEKLRNGE